MKALVISDTHGALANALTAWELAMPLDYVVHLGDGRGDVDQLRDVVEVPLLHVAGNCDVGSDAPREYLWECEGKRLLLTHGDAYQVKSGLAALLNRVRAIGADAALFGHTHLPVVEQYHGVLLINPGTLATFSNRRSYAIVEITTAGISVRHYPLA